MPPVLSSVLSHYVDTLIFNRISRLNTWPARTPVNASAAALLPPPHDSGPVWLATPSPYGSLIHDTLPVFPALSGHFSSAVQGDIIALLTQDLSLELTEFIDSVNLDLVHGNLLLALRVMGLGYPYAIRRLLLFLRDNFFPLCYTSKDLLLFLKYITVLL